MNIKCNILQNIAGIIRYYCADYRKNINKKFVNNKQKIMRDFV